MKRQLLLLSALTLSTVAFAQQGRVGVNTENPAATLDVVGKPIDATIVDGVIAPRLTGNELKAKDAVYLAPQTGALVYATAAVTGTPAGKTINVTSAGYYYFDGLVWVKQAVTSGAGAADITNDAWINNPATTSVILGTASDGTTARSTTGANLTRVAFNDLGYLGIGTNSPASAINIESNNGLSGDDIRVNTYSNDTFNGGLSFTKNRGTSAAPASMVTNDGIFDILGSGNINGTRVAGLTRIRSTYTGTGAAGSNLTDLQFETSAVQRMIIDGTGNVGIGTTSPTVPFQVVKTGNDLLNVASFGSADNKRVTITQGGALNTAGDLGIGRNSTTNVNGVIDFNTSRGDAADSNKYTARILRQPALDAPFNIVQSGPNSMNFYTNSSGNGGLNGVQAFSLDNAGNGTIANKLFVRGNTAGVYSGGGTHISWNDAILTGQSGIGYTHFINNQGTGTGGFIFTGTTGTDAANNKEYMRIAGNGNVGIGLATIPGSNITPSSKLQVEGSFSLPIKSGNTVGPNDHTILGTGNITLPSPVDLTGRMYNFIYDGTTYIVSGNIRLNGVVIPSYTINTGSGNLNNSPQGYKITVQSNGTSWVVVDRN